MVFLRGFLPGTGVAAKTRVYVVTGKTEGRNDYYQVGNRDLTRFKRVKFSAFDFVSFIPCLPLNPCDFPAFRE